MNFLDKLFGRPAEPELVVEAPQQLVVPPRPFVNTQALDDAGLRMGMWVWVKSGEGLGIITGANINGMGEITLQKDDGTTRMTLDQNDRAVPSVCLAKLELVRMAHIEEIPESRHEGVDHLRSFGYVNASET